MKGSLIILLFFLVSGCPLLKDKTRGKNKSLGKGDNESPYEIPPHPPIPPERYCYELRQGENGQNVTKLELTITGDSVSGKVEQTPLAKNKPDGILVGVVYGNTLLVSYKYATEGSKHSEDQEWKLSGDSIYRKITETALQDSSHTILKDSDQVILMPALHKVPCR